MNNGRLVFSTKKNIFQFYSFLLSRLLRPPTWWLDVRLVITYLDKVYESQQFIEDSKWSARDKLRIRVTRGRFLGFKANGSVFIGCENFVSWVVDYKFLLDTPGLSCVAVCLYSDLITRGGPTEIFSWTNILDFSLICKNPLFLVQTLKFYVWVRRF